MKAYLFEHEIIVAGGSRYELYVPDFGILWPGFGGRMITDSEEMDKMQKRVDKIHEQIQKGPKIYARKFLNYELVREKRFLSLCLMILLSLPS